MANATSSELSRNAFIGRRTKPADSDLAGALGSAKPVWDRLLAGLAARYGVTGQEWKCHSTKAGWALRLLRGKRTIVWLAPCAGCFRVAFALGDKAVLKARESALPESVLRIIEKAVKYPEGTAVRLHIRESGDLAAVETLVAVKIDN